MKLRGKIAHWNDDKGVGFVEQNGGGQRAFVHIKAFKPHARRPVNGEIIIYDLVRDPNNRYKAENIQFARDVKHSLVRNKAKKSRTLATIFTLLFCTWLFISMLSGKLVPMLAIIYLVMSLLTFMAYAIDKSAAHDKRWRTQESTLHTLSLIGGWPGAFLLKIYCITNRARANLKMFFGSPFY